MLDNLHECKSFTIFAGENMPHPDPPHKGEGGSRNDARKVHRVRERRKEGAKDYRQKGVAYVI